MKRIPDVGPYTAATNAIFERNHKGPRHLKKRRPSVYQESCWLAVCNTEDQCTPDTFAYSSDTKQPLRIQHGIVQHRRGADASQFMQ